MPFKSSGDLSHGAVYIFKRLKEKDTWVPQQELTSSDKKQNDQFGWSVSVSGNYAIVGAFYKKINGQTAQGAAYIYKRS